MGYRVNSAPLSKFSVTVAEFRRYSAQFLPSKRVTCRYKLKLEKKPKEKSRTSALNRTIWPIPITKNHGKLHDQETTRAVIESFLYGTWHRLVENTCRPYLAI